MDNTETQETRKAVINIRFTATEKAIVRKAAFEQRQSISGFVAKAAIDAARGIYDKNAI